VGERGKAEGGLESGGWEGLERREGKAGDSRDSGRGR